jgi:hypothetical protein
MKVYLPVALLMSLDSETREKLLNCMYRKNYGQANLLTDEPFVIVPDDLYSKFITQANELFKLLDTVHNQESELKALREVKKSVDEMRKLFK